MDTDDFLLTVHAEARCAQRNLSYEEVQYVIRHGRQVQNAGTCEFFLGRNDIPPGDRARQRIAQLEGTVVLMDIQTGLVLTVYRNRKNGLKNHRRKAKYNRCKVAWKFDY